MGDGTSIGKVRGLGASHSGSHHWLLQRFTAIGNLFLLIWLLTTLLMLPNFNFTTMHEWAVRPLTSIGLGLLIVSTFWHAKLGVQLMLEDYVHEAGNKFACVVALNLAVIAGAGFGLLCILRLLMAAAGHDAAAETTANALKSVMGGR